MGSRSHCITVRDMQMQCSYGCGLTILLNVFVLLHQARDLGRGEEEQVPAMNPAADPRLMRRVIAEDPKWNLETILPLKDVIIKFIVDNFHSEQR